MYMYICIYVYMYVYVYVYVYVYMHMYMYMYVYMYMQHVASQSIPRTGSGNGPSIRSATSSLICSAVDPVDVDAIALERADRVGCTSPNSPAVRTRPIPDGVSLTYEYMTCICVCVCICSTRPIPDGVSLT